MTSHRMLQIILRDAPIEKKQSKNKLTITKKTNNRRQNQNIHHSDHTNTDILLPKRTCLQEEKKKLTNTEFKSKKTFPMKNLYSLNNEHQIKLNIL